MSKKVKDQELELWFHHGICIKERIIEIDTEIDSEIVGIVNRGILYMSKLNNNPITIYIDSFGGSVTCANGLYDTIRNCPCEINTIARGAVMSAATDVFLAGDNRSSYSSTIFMFHTSSDCNYGKIFTREDEIYIEKQMWDKACKMYSERTEYKTPKWWKSWLQYRDRYLTATQAKELGVIHEIIGE